MKKFNFDNRVEKLLNDAQQHSVMTYGTETVTTQCLFVVMSNYESTLFHRFLSAMNLDTSTLLEMFEFFYEQSKEFLCLYKQKIREPRFSPELEHVLNIASVLAVGAIDEMALTVSLVENSNISELLDFITPNFGTILKSVFNTRNYINGDILYEIEALAKLPVDYDTAKFNNSENYYSESKHFETENTTVAYYKNTDNLNVSKNLQVPEYLTCLNDKFKPGNPYLIRGVDDQIEQISILLQKVFMPNIILVGEAGVGKTAIVEGLAERIVNKTCSESLKNYTIYSLDLTSFTKNTKFRGEQEAKYDELKNFLESATNVILFIDEIHNIIGMGSASDQSFDFSNALKPILSNTNSNVRIIGATTKKEYDKYFVDSAFKRRFSLVEVHEPKTKELYSILEGQIEFLEKRHGVSVSRQIFEKVVSESSGYHFDEKNPSRTIKMLDTAMVIAKNDGKKELDNLSIYKVHQKNVEMFLKTDKDILLRAAYHEAGHYIVCKTLNQKFNHVTLVSIIPSDTYFGVMCIEANDIFTIKSRKDYINEIAELLAGEIASTKKGFEVSLGMSNDTEVATNIAKHMVASSMEDWNLSGSIAASFLENDQLNLSLLSDKKKDEFLNKIDKILEEAHKIALRILNANDEILDIIAQALVKNGSLKADELDDLFTGKIKLEDLPAPDWKSIKKVS